MLLKTILLFIMIFVIVGIIAWLALKVNKNVNDVNYCIQMIEDHMYTICMEPWEDPSPIVEEWIDEVNLSEEDAEIVRNHFLRTPF